jgi:hypothetical protein
MVARVLFMCLLSLPVVGCKRAAPAALIDTGGPSGTTTWHLAPQDGSKLPGIDEGGAQYIGKLLVIWSSETNGGGCSDSQNSAGITSKGRINFTNGRQINFELVTADGKTGRVTIDGTNYELADGPLFLVAPDGDKYRVKQLKKDLSGLELKAEGFQAFGRSDADIMEFFTGNKPDKPKED